MSIIAMNIIAQDDDVRRSAFVWTEDGSRYITELQRATHIVKNVVSFMDRLLSSDHELFEIVERGEKVVLHKDRLGEEFLRILRFDLAVVERHFAAHRHSPLFTIFKRFSRNVRCCALGRVFANYVQPLNACVSKMRAFRLGNALTRRLANLRRGEQKNRKALQSLLQELRSTYSKLLAVRLDLGYYSKFVAHNLEAQSLSLDEVRAHRDLLLRYLRTGPYSKSLVGYVWRLEYGLEKGYHFHFAIMFNGQFVVRDISIASAIGRYWKEVITGGKGMFHNCNQKKEDYERCGIGLVNRFDHCKWEALKGALGYLTKQDMYLRFRPGPSLRTFGVGGPYRTSAFHRARVRRLHRLGNARQPPLGLPGAGYASGQTDA